MIKSNKNQDMPIEEILKSIKGIIDNRDNSISISDDEILELTNVSTDEEDIDNTDKLDKEEESKALLSDKSALETSKILQDFSKSIQEINVATQNSKSKTLEELVIKMLRPQLSEWLDNNLPALVKKMVEIEIQKLIENTRK